MAYPLCYRDLVVENYPAPLQQLGILYGGRPCMCYAAISTEEYSTVPLLKFILSPIYAYKMIIPLLERLDLISAVNEAW